MDKLSAAIVCLDPGREMTSDWKGSMKSKGIFAGLEKED